MDARVLADFVGHWQIDRVITHADGGQAHLSGTAEFSWQGSALLYQEEGLLRIGTAAPVQAQQRYIWEAGLDVHFGDGRPFHRVPPLGGETAHWCDPDQYDGFYDFSGWPDWSLRWQVRGPRKDYVSLTQHQRLQR